MTTKKHEFDTPGIILAGIFILIGIEMMLTAANVNFVAFWRLHPAGHAGGHEHAVLDEAVSCTVPTISPRATSAPVAMTGENSHLR